MIDHSYTARFIAVMLLSLVVFCHLVEASSRESNFQQQKFKLQSCFLPPIEDTVVARSGEPMLPDRLLPTRLAA